MSVATEDSIFVTFISGSGVTSRQISTSIAKANCESFSQLFKVLNEEKGANGQDDYDIQCVEVIEKSSKRTFVVTESKFEVRLLLTCIVFYEPIYAIHTDIDV